ncbi:hypothetical protein SRHO_G00283820 [Serrasalmus rhombeus]
MESSSMFLGNACQSGLLPLVRAPLPLQSSLRLKQILPFTLDASPLNLVPGFSSVSEPQPEKPAWTSVARPQQNQDNSQADTIILTTRQTRSLALLSFRANRWHPPQRSSAPGLMSE